MDPETQVALSPWAVALNLPAMTGETAPAPSAEVVPPPDANGVIEGRDGRRYRMADAAALAARINAQAVKARIDFDHRSERKSPTFSGSTAAEGWLNNARPNARGGIDADLELSGWAAMSLRQGSYRYLSPALFHTSDMEITGLSSVGLVNDPNFNLPAPTVHSQERNVDDENAIAEREKALEARERALDVREQAAAAQALNAATRAVEQAAADGKIPAAAKDAHLEMIKSHKDGIDAGLNAFEKLIASPAEGGAGGNAGALSAAALETLQTRVGPSGAPNAAATAPNPAYPAPAGVLPPDDERLSLHRKIADYAQKNGVSYRDAVTHFGATGV